MNDLDDNLGRGVLYVSGTRGYSAYEIAVQNGFVGTEQEWLDSLVGPQGEPGTPFDELTEEQKEEIRGDEGKSAYEVAVEKGFIGTEQDWINSFLTPDGYYNKTQTYARFKVNNTMSQSDIQSIMNIQSGKIIDFEKGTYNFSSRFVMNANTILNLNDSTLVFTITRGFMNFLPDEEPLEYKGKGNIAIIGGVIQGTSCSFCHASNILFKDVYFLNCRSNHVLEMMAIRDLVVDGCTFKGYDSDDLEKEYIQIDDPTYTNFPWFTSQDNPTYDNTPNENWTIKNSSFLAPTDEGFEFGVAIGSHTNYLINDVHHRNIFIYQNYFDGYSHSAIRLKNVFNSRIHHNIFKNGSNDSLLVRTIRLENNPSEIYIENNYVDCNGNTAFIFCNSPNENISVSSNKIYNCTKESGDTYSNNHVLYFQRPENLIVNNNLFYMPTKQVLFVSDTNDTEEAGMLSFVNNQIRIAALNDPCVIKILTNANVTIMQNNFDVGLTSKYVIVLGSSVVRAYIKDNKMSASIKEKALDLNGYVGILTQIDNIYFQTYNGSSTYSDISSGTMTYDYTSFNTMVITCGTGNNTHHYKLRDFYPYNKLSTRKYRLPSFDTSTDTIGVIDITLNSDKTFDYRSSNSVPLRAIYLINE